ncbi:MAG: hypothetical protein IJF03_09975 [Lachnospiraceae bacterium]|nr:hypothetical protein [Lachnospiraceae bacterium]
MKKSTRAREFSAKTREAIKERDKMSCIFCKMGYHMESTTQAGYIIKSIMHYIPRSKGGLGIEQNGAIGCQYHHELLDNGNKGLRGEMLELFKGYLKEHYQNWNEEELIYKK